jgi:hypothetical protein
LFFSCKKDVLLKENIRPCPKGNKAPLLSADFVPSFKAICFARLDSKN